MNVFRILEIDERLRQGGKIVFAQNYQEDVRELLDGLSEKQDKIDILEERLAEANAKFKHLKELEKALSSANYYHVSEFGARA